MILFLVLFTTPILRMTETLTRVWPNPTLQCLLLWEDEVLQLASKLSSRLINYKCQGIHITLNSSTCSTEALLQPHTNLNIVSLTLIASDITPDSFLFVNLSL